MGWGSRCQDPDPRDGDARRRQEAGSPCRARETIAQAVSTEGAAINAVCLVEIRVGETEPTIAADRIRDRARRAPVAWTSVSRTSITAMSCWHFRPTSLRCVQSFSHAAALRRARAKS